MYENIAIQQHGLVFMLRDSYMNHLDTSKNKPYNSIMLLKGVPT